MALDLSDALGILIAALGGAAVGLEREWSGHASGPGARFAGIRTFTLLGLQAGLVGWLWSNGLHVFAGLLLAGCAALILAAYVAASRVEVDGTTEVAALVVLGAGVVAGMHELRLASATIAVTTLLLVEKSRLHRIIKRIDDASLRAGFRFAVMAVVILPILPVGPYGPLGGIRPRQLWAMVLFFSGMSFAGYLARRSVGPKRGYPIAGMLGGIVSSTNVTLSFARASRSEIDAGTPLALGVIGASAVMCLRVLVATAVLNLPVSRALVPYLVAPFLAAAFLAWWGVRKHPDVASAGEVPSNPLQFASALQMAVLFQVVLFAVHWAQSMWGETGVFLSAGVLGLTDVDALVVSIVRDAGGQLPLTAAARAIAIGVFANTLLKLSIGVLIGAKQFRRVVLLGLLAVALACAVSLAWLR
ncbi:MAG: MgtC/SapB family protein [Candidatus Acidiferrum sp.]